MPHLFPRWNPYAMHLAQASFRKKSACRFIFPAKTSCEVVMTKRIHNFNPGPSALPLSVLEEIQAEFLDFKGSGMSITEISHRSPLFGEVLHNAMDRTRRLLDLPEHYHVLFVQGGASMQFAMVPMNLLGKEDAADYINTGTWSTKAYEQAVIQEKNVRYAASSEKETFSCLPETFDFNPRATYVHMTSNNTIRGTQWHTFPDTNGVPLVCDMCSDIFSRPLPIEKFGLIYAGAQKNMGPAGVAMVIIRDDLLDRVPETVPTLLRYRTYADKESMFNTPPCFGIYVIEKVLAWLEEEVGGLDEMQKKNREKAAALYAAIDGSDFFRGTAKEKDRSLMNATFRLADPELEPVMVEEALKAGLGGLKGHKSVGGLRASIYNATTMEAVTDLISFMKDFAAKKG